MKRAKEKGQYGYRNYRKRMRLLLVLIGVAAILIQLAARQITDNQSARNILTVMAILSVLPTANLASPLIASWRFKSPAEAFYAKVHPYEKDYPILYDLIVTTREQILPFDAAVVHPRGIYVFCPSQRADTDKAEKALNSFLSAQKLAPNMKIIKNEKQFLQRLSSLKPASEYEDDKSADYVVRFLKNMSM